MWGRLFGLVLMPIAIVLLLIAIAFGTSALLFPVIIAAVIGVVMLIVYGMRRGEARVDGGRLSGGTGRQSGAPVAGEGSGSPLSAAGKTPE
jgi:uncharacterized membrane protein